MNAVVIPVRSISDAKIRLSDCLTSDQRERLALTMLGDMLRAVTRAATVDRVVVVTGDARFFEYASRHGAEVLDEGEARGINAAVATAAARLEQQGVERVLIIPGDVPLIESTEINVLFASDSHRFPVVMVPSLSGEGTNGLLLSPPSVLAPCFEGSSLYAHEDACKSEGLRCLTLDIDGFKLDVDTPQDLAVLRATGRTESAELIRSWQGLVLPLVLRGEGPATRTGAEPALKASGR